MAWATFSILALTRCWATFLEAAADEEDRLSSAELALQAASEASMAHKQEQRDLRHDARNALAALRMATQTLAAVGDRLDEKTRQRLRGGVLEEVGHLDDLITCRTTTQHAGTIGVAKERLPLGVLPAQRKVTHRRSAVAGV